ncbi:hypothetical protein [Streptomyces sp. Ru72]|uniref:hypothetical protein n=1 Tax=Streptomyces sp. Ru72 TaxID=2080747 RepID=UPI0015E2DA0F|nr:hypothetical protein [Streptomyces sp. Ru72]
MIPALSPLSAKAAAAAPQTHLETLVNMRLGMFNHFSLGTFANQEWAAPNRDPGAV